MASAVATVVVSFFVLQILASLWVLKTFPPLLVLEPTDPIAISHFRIAQFMLLPALLLESCHIISGFFAKPSFRNGAFHMSKVVLLEYIIKIATYSIMANDSGMLHINLRAADKRVCYSVRWVGWCAAVPLLNTIYQSSLYDSLGGGFGFLRRAGITFLGTMAYTVACWVGLVTTHAEVGWLLLVSSFIGWVLTVVDQVLFVAEQKVVVFAMGLKISMYMTKEVVFAVYAVVCLTSTFGICTPMFEQVFYTYCDVFLKVATASCLVIFRSSSDMDTSLSEFSSDMKRLLQRASVPIVSLNKDGTISCWNDQIARVTLMTERSVLGQSFVSLLTKDCEAKAQSAMAACSRGASSAPIEISFLEPKAKKETKLVMNFVSQLGGMQEQIVGLGQDLTEVMNLKEIQERKARFTAIVSHELRSPLHGITGLTSAMAEAASDMMQKKQLKMIQGCASRLLDLVTNIMEMANVDKKNEEEKREMPKTQVNVMDVIDEVVSMTKMAMDKAGKPLVNPRVQLINNMSTGMLPTVSGDPYRCTQLFYNLVTNACKFTAQGSVSLSARHDRANSVIEVDVKDTGKGIPPEALARIFEPFRQEKTTEDSKGRFEGIGLGLSVALGITKLHKGEIRVQSTLGEGSTFTVRLPCNNNKMAGLSVPTDATRSELPRLPSVPSTTSMVTMSKQSFKGKPLLLSVDDDEINQEVIEKALGAEYRVHRAMDGMQALSYLSTATELPTLVLLDVMMPGLTGFEVVKEIRTKLGHTHLGLPVVMHSAKSPHEETAREAFANGATDFMPKPFSTTVLKMRLNVLQALRNDSRQLIGRGDGGAAEKPTAAPDLASAAMIQELEKRLKAKEEEICSETAVAAKVREEAMKTAEALRNAERTMKRLELQVSEAEKRQLRDREALSKLETESAALKSKEAEAQSKVKSAEEKLKEAEAKVASAQAAREKEPFFSETASMRERRGMGMGPASDLPYPPGRSMFGGRSFPMGPSMLMDNGMDDDMMRPSFRGPGPMGNHFGRRSPRPQTSSPCRYPQMDYMGGMSASGRSTPRRDQEVEFLRSELDMQQEMVLALREKLEKWRSEAWIQRENAESLEREVMFLRTKLAELEGASAAPPADKKRL